MQKLPNLNAPLVDIKTGKCVPPWNTFFSQFGSPPAGVTNVVVGTSPFSFTPNINGSIVISGGTVSLITLTRGATIITIATSTANPIVIPISIADTIIVTWTVKPTIQVVPS